MYTRPEQIHSKLLYTFISFQLKRKHKSAQTAQKLILTRCHYAKDKAF